jgi:hypothetical protein
MTWKPTTKLGVGALTLAVLAVLSFGVIMVSIAAFGGIATAWLGALLVALYIGAGVGSGVMAVLSIFKRRERGFLVYLALIPAAFATFLVVGEVLYLIVLVLTGRPIH